MEFYMADGELLCQYPDGSVKPVTDSDTDFIRDYKGVVSGSIQCPIGMLQQKCEQCSLLPLPDGAAFLEVQLR